MDYTYRDLIKEPPDLGELRELAELGKMQVKDLVNVRSQAFKKLQPVLQELGENGIAALIKQEPRIMLRPIITDKKGLLAGFKEEEYQKMLIQR